MKVLDAPLDTISRAARPYPAWLLSGCDTGLCLFAAAFLGHNDAIHFARYELQTTCVDRDAERLEEMAHLYPPDWDFLADDSWEFAEAARERGERWDGVSVDTFLGDATDRSLTTIDLWCSLADRFVTMTVPANTIPETPGGWRPTIFVRSTQASWLMLERWL